MKQIMKGMLKVTSACMLSAVLASQAIAAPDSIRTHEVLKVDLSGSIAQEQLSVVVAMPAACPGVELSLICQQFREFKPKTDDKYVYAALDGLVKPASIADQVQALPAAVKARRYVMLVDWAYVSKRVKSSDYVYLNGEVGVYDQQERKVVWHSIELYNTYKIDTGFADAASSFITYDATGGIKYYGRTIDNMKKVGYALHPLASLPQGDAGNLVIFNERGTADDDSSLRSALVTVNPSPKPPGNSLVWFHVPKGSYFSLSLPPGKYVISHWHKEEFEVEIAPQQRRAYLLSDGMFRGRNVTEVSGQEFANMASTSRNLMQPDTVARNRYSGTPAWSDTPQGEKAAAVARPVTPDVIAAAVPAPAAAAAQRSPARSSRRTARIRFLGAAGTKIKFYENRLCFGSTTPGTDVSGADGAYLGWLRGKNESVSVGMPDTEITSAIQANPKKGHFTYYREFEVAAGKAVSIGMSASRTYSSMQGTTEASCQSGRAFVPAAGADYEASFQWGGGRCSVDIKEIGVEQGAEPGELRQYPVETVKATSC